MSTKIYLGFIFSLLTITVCGRVSAQTTPLPEGIVIHGAFELTHFHFDNNGTEGIVHRGETETFISSGIVTTVVRNYGGAVTEILQTRGSIFQDLWLVEESDFFFFSGGRNLGLLEASTAMVVPYHFLARLNALAEERRDHAGRPISFEQINGENDEPTFEVQTTAAATDSRMLISTQAGLVANVTILQQKPFPWFSSVRDYYWGVVLVNENEEITTPTQLRTRHYHSVLREGHPTPLHMTYHWDLVEVRHAEQPVETIIQAIVASENLTHLPRGRSSDIARRGFLNREIALLPRESRRNHFFVNELRHLDAPPAARPRGPSGIELPSNSLGRNLTIAGVALLILGGAVFFGLRRSN